MKYISMVLALMFVCGVAVAKDYTVTVDDEIVPYFESAIEGLAPEEWLGLQAINQADMMIEHKFRNEVFQGKTRAEKISVIKKTERAITE